MNAVYILSNLGLLGFALASVVYLVSFQEGRTHKPMLGRTASSTFVLATLSVTAAVVIQYREASFSEAAALLLTSTIAWLAIAGHAAFNMRIIGAFVAPLSTLILLIKFFVAPMRVETDNYDGNSLLLTLHVVPAILGQAFAIIACAVSIVFLWQQSLLKKKLLDQLTRNLPAIDRLERILAMSLWCGFLFITLGLLSGALYAQLSADTLELNLPAKVIWAVLVWVWYLATLLARNVFNRPSKRIAQMSLAGFLLLFMTYFGMGFLRPVGGG